MSALPVEFRNPDNLPVESVTLSATNAGIIQQLSALDPYWVVQREFVCYERPPPESTPVFGAIDTWKVKMENYVEDLKSLLRLEHHRFWSTVLYHPQCMDALVSFLQEANPPYMRPHENRDVQKIYGEIRKLILVVFSRLITNKESKFQWMTKEHMADILYNKFIFTIPIVWDICLVYGVDNGPHVSRLLSSVFSLQPQYLQDAATAVAFVKEAFKYIILQVNKNYDSEEAPNLPETFKGFAEIRRPSNSSTCKDKMTFSMLKDLVVHLLDTAMTLRIFVEVYSKGYEILRKANFVNSIVQIYEYGIPQMYEKLEEVGDETSVQYTELEGYIDLARAELIDIYKEILAGYKSAVFSGEGSLPKHVEDYLSVVMDALAEKLFIKDYHACYPVQDDLELLRQAYPDIDSVKTDFILQAIYSNLDEPVPEHLLNGLTNGHVSTDLTNHVPSPSTSDQLQPTTDLIPSTIKEESLISEVKDILPHLGDGFVLKCLQHYNYDSERVISSILENNLAESLRDIEQSLPIIPEDPLDEKFLETGIQRLNVFDGDEFDIMTRDDVDVSRIHIGKKKSKYKNIKDMLDDKSDIRNRIDIYNKYNLVCDEEDAMYSDEYDDTYDTESRSRRGDNTEEAWPPFVTPRVLAQDNQTQESEEESEEEIRPEEKPSSSKSKLDFCVNPEEMRAKREANFQARRGKGHRPPPPKTADVTGKPRGQGQEKEVVVSRDKKEKHKSSRANHNRRQGAQWKRSQGMMPS